MQSGRNDCRWCEASLRWLEFDMTCWRPSAVAPTLSGKEGIMLKCLAGFLFIQDSWREVSNKQGAYIKEMRCVKIKVNESNYRHNAYTVFTLLKLLFFCFNCGRPSPLLLRKGLRNLELHRTKKITNYPTRHKKISSSYYLDLQLG